MGILSFVKDKKEHFRRTYSGSYMIQQKASLLFASCLCIIALSLFFTALNLISSSFINFVDYVFLVFNFMTIFTMALCFILLWRGNYYLASFIVIAFFSMFGLAILIASYPYYLQNGNLMGVFLFFVLIPAALLLDSVWVAAGLSTLYILVISGFFAMARFDPGRIISEELLNNSIMNILPNILIEAAMILIMLQITNTSLHKLESELHKNQILNEDLENRVKERTEELTSANSRLARIGDDLCRYLPAQLAESLVSGNSSAIAFTSRKKITIFFSDIKGFTEISDVMEAEDLSGLLNEYFTEMNRIARRWGGTVDKFIGDAVMVFFGAPESRGDKQDAISCARMALEMQKKMNELCQKWYDNGIEQTLLIRIGITTGVATVGNFGAEDRLSYTAIGQPVNVAARLESACEPGQILISHPTYALVKEEIACTPGKQITVKGINREIKVYNVKLTP